MGTGSQIACDENHLVTLKSSFSMGRPRPPVSRIEFEEDVRSFFVPLMSAQEKLGFQAFLLCFFDDLSPLKASQRLGVELHDLRRCLGLFSNLLAWLFPPENCAELPSNLSAALRCGKNYLAPTPKCKEKRGFLSYIPKNFKGASPHKLSLACSIAKSFQGLIRYGARKAMISHDDATQEACLQACRAISTFDPNKSPLRAFFGKCIGRGLATRAIHEYRQRKTRRLCLSMEAPLSSMFPDKTSFVRRRCPDASSLEVMNKRMSSLTTLELAVLKSRINGHTHKQAAILLGIKPKAVDNALCRISRKFSTKMPHQRARPS